MRAGFAASNPGTPLGRRVRKGEKGIAILAPCLYRADSVDKGRTRDADARIGPSPRGEARVPAAPAPAGSGRDPLRRGPDSRVPNSADADATRRQLRGFRVVHVFDQAQTVGEPLNDVTPTQLHGAAPARLTARLVQTISADGYAVERGPCTDGAFGHTDFTRRAVRVREDVAESQAAKVLAHELAHIRADHETRFLATYRTSHGCRAQAEVEAESIAFLVTNTAGLPTEAYSVPYLAGWSGGDTELLRDAATRVIGTARAIVTDLGLDRGASALRDPARPTRNHGVESPGRHPEPPAPEGLR